MSAFKDALLDLLKATRDEGVAIAVAKDDLFAEASERQAKALSAFLDLVPDELLGGDV